MKFKPDVAFSDVIFHCHCLYFPKWEKELKRTKNENEEVVKEKVD